MDWRMTYGIDQFCRPGTQVRTPHNHRACVATWPKGQLAEVPDQGAMAGVADEPADQVGGSEMGAGPAWGSDPGLLPGVWMQQELQGRDLGTLKYKLLSERAKPPRRGMVGDAGLDLTATEAVWVPVGGFKRVNLDVAVQLPEWCGALMMGRSSTVGRGLLVLGTVIDAGYRGELFCMVLNLTDRPELIEAETRVAQLVPFEAVGARFTLEEVEELDPSERGVNGFGSTGR